MTNNAPLDGIAYSYIGESLLVQRVSTASTLLLGLCLWAYRQPKTIISKPLFLLLRTMVYNTRSYPTTRYGNMKVFDVASLPLGTSAFNTFFVICDISLGMTNTCLYVVVDDASSFLGNLSISNNFSKIYQLLVACSGS